MSKIFRHLLHRQVRPLITLAIVASLAVCAVASPLRIAATRTSEGVLVSEAGQAVFFYRTAPPAGLESWRLHYIHPLHAPDGTVLTEDRPADHLHQRGVYWAWRRIMLDNRQVADSWAMENIAYRVRRSDFKPQSDGSGRLSLKVEWLLTSATRVEVLAIERTEIVVHPLADNNARRIDFDTTLTARRAGLSLAGTDDEKGYSGFSARFVRPDLFDFTTANRLLEPTPGWVAADGEVTMSWRDVQDTPPWRITLRCSAQGTPVRAWVLRRELSMQNCAFPGRKPVAVPLRQPLRLLSTLVIAPDR